MRISWRKTIFCQFSLCVAGSLSLPLETIHPLPLADYNSINTYRNPSGRNSTVYHYLQYNQNSPQSRQGPGGVGLPGGGLPGGGRPGGGRPGGGRPGGGRPVGGGGGDGGRPGRPPSPSSGSSTVEDSYNTGIDSYGVPLAAPLAVPDYEYPSLDYAGTATGYGAPSAPVVTDYPYLEYEYPEETTTLEPEYEYEREAELEIPKHTLVAMLAVAVLFLFPVTIFVDSAATSINRRPNRRPAGSSTTTTSDPDLDSFTQPETTTTTNVIPRILEGESELCDSIKSCGFSWLSTLLENAFLEKTISF